MQPVAAAIGAAAIACYRYWLLQLSIAAAICHCSYPSLYLSIAAAIHCCSYQSLQLSIAAAISPCSYPLCEGTEADGSDRTNALMNPPPRLKNRWDQAWQESHENEHKPCELLVLFSSCGILSAGSRMDNRPLPRQTLPEPHKFIMTSFTKCDVSFTQWRLTSSTKPSHIIPQGPHHHQELFKRSPVGFLLKSTGNRSRSWVQD